MTTDTKFMSAKYFEYCAIGILGTLLLPIVAIGAVILFPFYLIGRYLDK